MTDSSLTVADLEDMLADCDGDTRIRLDIPVLADVYDCTCVRREVKAYEADELVLKGYNDR